MSFFAPFLVYSCRLSASSGALPPLAQSTPHQDASAAEGENRWTNTRDGFLRTVPITVHRSIMPAFHELYLVRLMDDPFPRLDPVDSAGNRMSHPGHRSTKARSQAASSSQKTSWRKVNTLIPLPAWFWRLRSNNKGYVPGVFSPVDQGTYVKSFDTSKCRSDRAHAFRPGHMKRRSPSRSSM